MAATRTRMRFRCTTDIDVLGYGYGYAWSNLAARLSFSTHSFLKKKHQPALPPRPSLPDDELKHTFVKGTGPGGQKINKTNSAAQVTHLPTGIVVKCQATRSRNDNFKIAKRILAEKVEFLSKGEESRVAKVVDRARRKKASRVKKSRRKYKKLNQPGGEGENREEDEEEDDEEYEHMGDLEEEHERDTEREGISSVGGVDVGRTDVKKTTLPCHNIKSTDGHEEKRSTKYNTNNKTNTTPNVGHQRAPSWIL
ncbi:hypothetical protein H2204_000134 [Knufia peltigerae]|uniref:Prokaryotic-type class I peptide chain release factors domain-containing protein n=1 Tax=Knufia peltigerae TaxID=1002370 RepID=A0AA38YFN9_9EURO|nr:hypothetical protein H2204_000134 [Knufia peltigerae]